MRIKVTTSDDLQTIIDQLPDGPAELALTAGVHKLARTLVIRRGDLAVTGVPGQTVLDGGCRLSGWKPVEYNGRRLFAAPVPPEAIFDDTVNQFFADGVRQTRARYPRSGELTPVETAANPEHRMFLPTAAFGTQPGDFNPSWSDHRGIEVLLFTKWVGARLPIESYDAKENILKFRRYSRFPADPEYARYYFENVLEMVSCPGDYAFDRVNRRLLWLPPAGVDPDRAETVLPGVGALIAADGGGETAGSGRVARLRLEGLTLRHGGAWVCDDAGSYDLRDERLKNWRNYLTHARSGRLKPGSSVQGATELPGLLMLRGVTAATICNCVAEHGGWYAVNVGPGCSNITVSGCRFTDLGGGGVVISGGPATAARKRNTHRVSVTDNEISHSGRLQPAAVGILIGHARGNLLEHNEIFDLYYSGISCGWNWGYGENVTRENRIMFNRIHDIGQGVLCDMGGIYLLGIQPGSRICNNLIYRVRCRFYGGWALYADEGTSHTVWERNVCFDCSREGFHQHYGRENIVRFNVFAFHDVAGFALSTGTERLNQYDLPGDNFRINVNLFANVFVQAPDRLFYRTWERPHVVTPAEFYADDNLFFTVGGEPGKFIEIASKEFTFPDWQKTGLDRNSRFADPGFVSLENRDFHLSAHSLLRKINFPDPAETIDGAGRLKGTDR